jgi:hypothetical protein
MPVVRRGGDLGPIAAGCRVTQKATHGMIRVMVGTTTSSHTRASATWNWLIGVEAVTYSSPQPDRTHFSHIRLPTRTVLFSKHFSWSKAGDVVEHPYPHLVRQSLSRRVVANVDPGLRRTQRPRRRPKVPWMEGVDYRMKTTNLTVIRRIRIRRIPPASTASRG